MKTTWYRIILATILFLGPTLTYAQASVQTLIINLVSFLQTIVLPALLAVAFFILVFNMLRYFVWQSAEEEGRAAARNLAIYATLAFVLIVIFWGLIGLFVNALGLANDPCIPISDYINEGGTSCPPPVIGDPPAGLGNPPGNQLDLAPITPPPLDQPITPPRLDQPITPPPQPQDVTFDPDITESPLIQDRRLTIIETAATRIYGAAADTDNLGEVTYILNQNIPTTNDDRVRQMRTLRMAGIIEQDQFQQFLSVVNLTLPSGQEPYSLAVLPAVTPEETALRTAVEAAHERQIEITDTVYERYPASDEAAAAKMTEVLNALSSGDQRVLDQFND